MNNLTNLQVALGLAARAIRVFPCGPDKAPKIKGWEENAVSSRFKIEATWRNWPDALPAIPVGTHGLIVIDCDRRQGKPDGVKAFIELCAEHNIDTSAFFVVKTPSTGLHFYFRTDGAYGNSSGLLPKGIDVRGKGGYVIAPGATGYTHVAGSWDAIPALPESLAALLREKRPTAISAPSVGTVSQREREYAMAALEDECAKLSSMGEGSGRNAALNQAAHSMGTMIGAGWIERETVEQALWEASERNGYRAKDGDTAARATIKSGIDRGVPKPRSPLSVDEIPQYIRDSVALWIAAYEAKKANVSSFIDSILSPFDYESKDIEFAIQNFIPMSAITMLSGDAGCGKTTLSTYIGHAVAQGHSILGFAVPIQRHVLYLDRENSLPVIRERLSRLNIAPGSRFKYWGAHVTGEVPLPESSAIVEWIKRIEPKPVVIIDGQTAFLEGNENSSEDIRAFYNPLRMIANLGAAVIVLHHTGKGESTLEFRGSNDIKASIDVGYVLKNDGETRLGTVTVKPFKARFNVTDKFAMSYQNGVFYAENFRQASENVLMHVLQNNPGLNRAELEAAAMEKHVSRSQARFMIEDGIKAGSILTRKGDRNATLHYLPNAVPMQ